jgi:long-subunit acyl-CoA synthetase (AMP-forming)
MDFTKLTERMAASPERSLKSYDESGAVASRSYALVHADARRAVEQLKAWGVGEGMRVGILATNAYEWVVYDLALLQLKCTSVAFPDEFGSKSSGELVEAYDLGLLLLLKRDQWPAVKPGPWTAYMDAENPPGMRARPVAAPGASGEFIPSLTFSSGTSGKIKCLVTNLRGAEETIANFYRLFNIGSGDSFLVFLPLSSFQQRLMIYAGLYYGFDLLLVNPSQVFSAFKDFRPTLCLAPPLLYETIHARFTKAVRGLPAPKRLMLRGLSSLADFVPLPPLRERLLRLCYGQIYDSLGGRIRLMWTGMAPIKRATLDFFALMRLPVYEAYGLTECGAITSNTPAHNRRGSVGRPLVEGSVTLADDGEIIVRHEHLQTVGYLYCDPSEEAQTYIAPGTIATGDVGRFDRDGFLYLVGRKKELIITGQGYKLHPETLEAKIDRCPEVERSVVFGSDLPYIVALVSVQEPLTETVEARVRKHVERINAELPPVGRVVRFHITTEQFTRDNGLMTRNLKLDRRAIFRRFKQHLGVAGEQPAGEQHDGRADAEQKGVPQTGVEKQIAEAWREVLGVERVGLNDNFFELGGNSLLLAQVHGKLQQSLRRELSLVDVFDNPTINALARHLSAAEQPSSEPALQRVRSRAEKQREAINSRKRAVTERRGLS